MRKEKQSILVGATLYVMRWTVRSIVLFSFSILIYYLWTLKYTKMGQIFRSPYWVDNVSLFWFFWGSLLMCQLYMWACLRPSDFDPRLYQSVFKKFMGPSSRDCGTTKVDDKIWAEMDECHDIDEGRVRL